jgi:DNA-binding XRE family transcriptional regulator
MKRKAVFVKGNYLKGYAWYHGYLRLLKNNSANSYGEKCWIFPTFLVNLSKISNMRPKRPVVFPAHMKLLQQVGENIKLARKRRKFTSAQVAERAGINRSTLVEIEKGNPSVSMGAYFNTLRVMGLQNDFLKLAADDEYGRKLQDLALITK